MSGNDDPEPSLEAAYAVESPEDNRRLYANWAETYESEFMADKQYVYHHHVAAIFSDGLADKRSPVLDVGCGTGAVGLELRTMEVATIDGIDISPEMLAMARTKSDANGPVYRDLIEADLTGTIAIDDDRYAGVVSAGAFTHGHLGPDSLDELLRVGGPGAHFAIGINAAFYESSGFADRFARFEREGTISDFQVVEAIIYGGDSDLDDLNQVSRVAVFDLATDQPAAAL